MPRKIKVKDFILPFYTFSCQDSTAYLEYIFLFKPIAPTLSNTPSLKAAYKN